MNLSMPTARDDTALMIRRSFATDIETLFRALTDPAALGEWFGPGEVRVAHVESDLRVGGRWAIRIAGSDCENHEVSGEYLEIDAPRRLVFSWHWGSTPERVSRVTYALSADGPGRTTLTLTHERLYDKEVRDRHVHGWTGSLDKLEAWLARQGER